MRLDLVRRDKKQHLVRRSIGDNFPIFPSVFELQLREKNSCDKYYENLLIPSEEKNEQWKEKILKREDKI